MGAGEPSGRDLGRLYALCEDADAELGGLAAELEAGQLRSLVTDVLGALSALQWYAVKRLGGIPGHEDEPPADEPGTGTPWPELWSMAQDQALGAPG